MAVTSIFDPSTEERESFGAGSSLVTISPSLDICPVCSSFGSHVVLGVIRADVLVGSTCASGSGDGAACDARHEAALIIRGDSGASTPGLDCHLYRHGNAGLRLRARASSGYDGYWAEREIVRFIDARRR
jgi:hypothetical protein